jgi:hypothetical protein
MREKIPVTPSATSVQTKKKPPLDLAINRTGETMRAYLCRLGPGIFEDSSLRKSAVFLWSRDYVRKGRK